MTVSNSQPQSATSLHGLRDALEQAERQLVRLDRTNIQGFLQLLDQIEQMWTSYDDPSSLTAEYARWQSLLKRISTSPQLLTAPASQAGGLTKLRSQNPPATGLWWHVDEQVSGQRKQMWRRLVPIAGVVVLVVVAIWLINSFSSRNASTVDASQQIDQLVEAQKWQEALTVVDTALQKSPDDVDLLLWQAVLSEQLGNKQKAQTSLDLAQAKFVGTPVAFWTLVGNQRLEVGNWDGAEEAGQEALKSAPQDAEATFLLGRAAEGRGNMAQASEYYSQTVSLAGATNPELVALVKIRMGYMSQGAGPLPGPAPTPSTTQTATP